MTTELRSEVKEEVHLIPMRVLFQREGDKVIMKLPGYVGLETLVIGKDKGEAIRMMDETMYKRWGVMPNA
jgi:thioredoxin-related protein